MKKLFVFKLNGKVRKTIAQSIIDDAEILFEGKIGDAIPQEIQDQVDAQLALDQEEDDLKKAKREKSSKDRKDLEKISDEDIDLMDLAGVKDALKKVVGILSDY